MALSVGVVSIEYLEEPKSPVSDFLKHLAMHSSLGLSNGELWAGGWDGNVFLEFERNTLAEGAGLWCNDGGVSDTERAELLAWIADLPAQTDYVMLHIGL